MDVARAKLAVQLEAVRTGEATHTNAMRPEVLRLRAEADRLAPYIAECAFAAADLLDTEVGAVLGPGALRAVNSSNWLGQCDSMDVDDAYVRLRAATDALKESVGPDGEVHHEDVDQLAALARELDDGDTSVLRVNLYVSSDELFRRAWATGPVTPMAPSVIEDAYAVGESFDSIFDSAISCDVLRSADQVAGVSNTPVLLAEEPYLESS